jgi:hypothetical protein
MEINDERLLYRPAQSLDHVCSFSPRCPGSCGPTMAVQHIRVKKSIILTHLFESLVVIT